MHLKDQAATKKIATSRKTASIEENLLLTTPI